MRYILHNKELLVELMTAKELDDKIERLVSKAEFFSSSYKKPLLLDVSISDEGGRFLLSFDTMLKSSKVHVSKNGGDVSVLFDQLSEVFLRSLKRQIHKERKEQRRKRRKVSDESVIELLNQVGNNESEYSKETFIAELNGVLSSEVIRYVKNRLVKAELNGAIDVNKYSASEIIDQVYISVVEKNELNAFQNFDLKYQVFKEANKVLQEILREETFQHENFVPLEGQFLKEGNKLKEKIFVNTDGKLELEAEFSEPHCLVDYNSEDVIDDAEEELIHKLDQEMGRDKVKQKLAVEIMKLQPLEHAVYDHAVIEEMNLEDIASIYDLNILEVERILISVKSHLRHVLSNS